jgi:hypothetical protein
VEDSHFYAELQYVGPAGNANKYKYKLEFVNKYNTASITVMHLTRWYNEGLQDMYSPGGFGKLDFEEVCYLKDKKGNLMFKLEITKVGN